MTEGRHHHHKKMKSFFKKVLGGEGSRESLSPPPVAPPSPDISHLTPEELRILTDVIKRQEQFEQQEQERVRRLEAEMAAAEQELKGSQSEKRKKWRLASARLCRLCHKTRLSEGAGRPCVDCRKRVCGRCGSCQQSSRSTTDKGVWLCRLCHMKREVTCRTGEWYHGARGNAYRDDSHLTGSAAHVLRRKLRDFAADSTGSDLQTSGNDRGESDRETAPSCHGSDSQLVQGQLPAFRSNDPARSSGRRRSLPVGPGPPGPHRRPQDEQDDDDEDSIDDILLERKLSHRRRQQKKLRRRSVQNGQSGKGAGGATGSKSDLRLNSHVQEDQGTLNKQSGRELAHSAAQRPPLSRVEGAVALNGLEVNLPRESELQNTKLSPVRDQQEPDFSENEDPRSYPSQDLQSRATRSDRWSLVSQPVSTASTKRRAFYQSGMVPRKPVAAAVAGKSSSMSDSDQGSSPRTGYARSYSADSPRRGIRSGAASDSVRADSLTERRLNPQGSQVSCESDRAKRTNPFQSEMRTSDDRARKLSPSVDGSLKSVKESGEIKRAGSSRDVNCSNSERLRRVSPSRDKGDRSRRASPSRDLRTVREDDVNREASRIRRTGPTHDTLHAPSDRNRRVSPSRDRLGSPKVQHRSRDESYRRPSLPTDVTDSGGAEKCPRVGGSSIDVRGPRDRRSPNRDDRPPRKDRERDREYLSDGYVCSGDEVGPGKTDLSSKASSPSGSTTTPRRSRSRPPRQFSYDERLQPESQRDRSSRSPSGYPSSPEKSGPDPYSSSPTPYTCVTQALRNVSSPLEYVTSPDTGGASSACTCATPDTCIAKSNLSGVTECCACAKAIEHALKWRKEAVDYEGSLVHSILHKSPNTFPEAFGIKVMGGVSDGNGGLIAVIKSVVQGSPAHIAGLQQGDQLVAWSGQLLSGVSFEQALAVIADTKADVVHVLALPKDLVGRTSSPLRSCSRLSDLEHPVSPHGHSPITWGSESALSMGHASDGSATGHKRRILPKTPAEIGRDSRQMSGEILLSLEYDPPTAILYVTLLKGRGLGVPKAGSNPEMETHGLGQGIHKQEEHRVDSRPSSAGGNLGGGSGDLHGNTKRIRQTLELPHVTVKGAGLSGSETEDADHDVICSSFPSPFAMVHMLPKRKSRQAHKTEIRKHSRRPKWEQTFVYDSFTITELVSRCLEITVWSRESGGDEFLGEVLLELREWRHYTHATWCRLYDHDANSSPLPRPRHLLAHDSVVSSASSSCYDDLSNKSPDLQDGHRLSPTSGQPDTITTKLSKVTKGMVRNRNRLVSRVSSSFSHADRSLTGSDESSPGDLNRRRSVSETHVSHDDKVTSPGISRHPSYNMDLLAPPRPLSRANSSSSFFLSDDSSDGDPYSPTSLTPDRPAPEGDDITSILGPGQVPPRPSSETLVCGDIKLGLAISKGQLEVDIICVRGLQRSPQQAHPPDTYVKTYLVEGHKTIQKKKTQVVKASADPIFRRKIKYSACNVHGRHMRIVLWERPRNFERKQSLGEAVIKLDSVDLSVHTMTWYKLFPVNSTDLGSTDSLSQW